MQSPMTAEVDMGDRRGAVLSRAMEGRTCASLKRCRKARR